MQFNPLMTTCEIAFTYRCNVKCNNCSSLCTQAPAYFDITPEHLGKFIDESVAINYPWKVLTIHGGEPALHPQFHQLCGMLAEYRDRFNNDCKVWVLTNNSSEIIRQRLSAAINEFRIGIGIADKRVANISPDGKPMLYVPINQSPADIGAESTQGCNISRDCGLCYNYAGYWVCSPMGAATRVFDLKPICTNLAELSEAGCIEAFTYHCNNCGFSNPSADRVHEQITSQTWEAALKKYKERYWPK